MNKEKLIKQIENLRVREKIEVVCDVCNKPFLKAVRDIKRTLRLGYKTLACSMACNGKARKVCGENRNCLYCQRIFYFIGNPLETKEGLFCSHSCSASLNNRKKKKTKFCIFCKKLNTRGGNYCSNNCSMEDKDIKYITVWQQGLLEVKSENVTEPIKRYTWKKYNNKCANCGWCEINLKTGKSPLNIDHIDGNCTNNKEENLRLLCPNCHSLTPTYGSLNLGKSRRIKRYKAKPTLQ